MAQNVSSNEDEPDVSSPQSGPSAYSEDGVDLTLIRWLLSLTPGERLQVAQHAAQSLGRLRGNGPDA
jgi:hypothetical protein